MKSIFKLIFSVLIINPLLVGAQASLKMVDMSEFRPQAGNWSVVGDVVMNPDVDIHAMHELSESKKKKKTSDTSIPEAVTFSSGTGILLNMNSDVIKDNLLTIFEHGDIELELEVMLPKGSNSGLYLQGRYEVQLFDSWGVKQPKSSDMGGIYRNWESDPDKIFMGKAPISNPSKAPGLWQKLSILFVAPTFDDNGNKITNAKLQYVDLNGVRIHKNVEIPKLTGGPIGNDEVSMGPIMIQGDHGPVAIRNFKYRLLSNAPVVLNGLTYNIYESEAATAKEIFSGDPKKSGSTEQLSVEVLNIDNNYGLTFSGQIVIGKADDYTFTLGYTGGGKLIVDGKVLVDQLTTDRSGEISGTLKLNPGSYPIEIQNIKTAPWYAPRLGLTVKGANTHGVKLHSFASYPDDTNLRASIYLDAGSKIRLHRGFVDFIKNEKTQRMSHTIAVGSPDGIHYIIDLNTSNMICAWRGDFVDATPMWYSRGNGSFKPRGAVQYTFLNQSLAYLNSPEDLFPETGDKDFQPKGYEIDKVSGRPTFNHIYKNLKVSTSISPDPDNNYLTTTILIEGTPQAELYYKLAEGKEIIKLPNGTFAIGDLEYYIKPGSAQPTIREVNGMKELILPVAGNTINYSIIW